ncbi:hypothetical protein EC991_001595 [Linnemannia zychae]|nr:hypothetical protein EC991_001595 [Linnemannia zychae]
MASDTSDTSHTNITFSGAAPVTSSTQFSLKMNMGIGENVHDSVYSRILKLDNPAELEAHTEIAAVAPASSLSLLNIHLAAASKSAHQRLSKAAKSNYDCAISYKPLGTKSPFVLFVPE